MRYLARPGEAQPDALDDDRPRGPAGLSAPGGLVFPDNDTWRPAARQTRKLSLEDIK
jgi:hypothetical protein